MCRDVRVAAMIHHSTQILACSIQSCSAVVEPTAISSSCRTPPTVLRGTRWRSMDIHCGCSKLVPSWPMILLQLSHICAHIRRHKFDYNLQAKTLNNNVHIYNTKFSLNIFAETYMYTIYIILYVYYFLQYRPAVPCSKIMLPHDTNLHVCTYNCLLLQFRIQDNKSDSQGLHERKSWYMHAEYKYLKM